MAKKKASGNGSQFFIATTENPEATDGKHTVFGAITPASLPVVSPEDGTFL